MSIDLDVPHARVYLPSGLRVVYANLVRNAIQDSAPDGYVKVQARVDHQVTLELSIADNGEGIPENIRERIFEPFATSRAEDTVLALVDRYVHEAGGYVTCTSYANKGTTFTIYWPGAGEVCAADSRPYGRATLPGDKHSWQ